MSDVDSDLPAGVLAEDLCADAGYFLRGAQLLEAGRSPWQRYEVWDTPRFGRLFRLDGCFMTSERDEFHYHENLIHVPGIAHPGPRSVLIIGGGDGGSAEELLKYPSMERIVLAELDERVVDLSRRYLQAVHHGALDDPRVAIRIGDGMKYVREDGPAAGERYDMIVLDLTDPDTPAFHLYSEEFFRMCQRILKPGGMLTLHLGSPVYQPETVRKNATNLRKVFRHVAPLSLFIPLYGSLWCLAVASDSIDPRSIPVDTIAQRMSDRRIGGLSYYYPAMHPAVFTLPLFVQELTQPPSSTAGSVARVPQLRAA